MLLTVPCVGIRPTSRFPQEPAGGHGTRAESVEAQASCPASAPPSAAALSSLPSVPGIWLSLSLRDLPAASGQAIGGRNGLISSGPLCQFRTPPSVPTSRKFQGRFLCLRHFQGIPFRESPLCHDDVLRECPADHSS